MKILILNYEYPPIGGGAGVVSKYHAEELAKRGHEVFVLTTWFKGEKELETNGNLTIKKIKSKRRYDFKSTPDEWLSWISQSKKFLNNYLQENKFDYCFAHFALPGGEVGKYIHKKFKLPFAIISHGHDIPWFFPKQMFKYHLITYFYIKKICKKADKLILLTNDMKKNADRFMGKMKYKNIIIPNGCETDIYKPNYSLKSDKFKIIFVGRLVAQKAPFVFLKAINLLQKKISNVFDVNILGDGPLLNKMKKFVIENNLNDVVNFKGWVSKEEILKEYQSAHLQVISSEAEAMSIAALESLSSGLYIISTPVSGNTDIIEVYKNGVFFDIGDYKTLANKILEFNKTKFQNNFKVDDTFLNNFREKYDWTKIAEKLEEAIL